MRGRHPSGPEYVEHLQGSAQAKERLRLILETMTGKRRVQEACQLLKISPQRFEQLRTTTWRPQAWRPTTRRGGADSALPTSGQGGNQSALSNASAST
jgi:hypothetical protein